MDDIVERLNFYGQASYGKESLDGAYEAASLCLEAAQEILHLRKELAEHDTLVINGPDGQELCRFEGEEATRIIGFAAEKFVREAIKRLVDDRQNNQP